MYTTVIFYTANREHPDFEQKICSRLLKSIGNLPLISVSHKPMPGFGHNICVGDMPWGDLSAHRQLQIGLKAATTPFAIAAESDCLYPPEYFSFVPPHDDRVYRYTNVYIIYSFVGRESKGLFWRKQWSEGGQMCGRQYWIDAIDKTLDKANKFPEKKPPLIFQSKDAYQWSHEHPMVSFKTSAGLRRYTAVGNRGSTHGYRDLSNARETIPYWGSSQELRDEICGSFV